MIPTAQFDPASLALWTTTGSLAEPMASKVARAMQLAASGEDPSPSLDGTSGAQRARLLWLTSSVWHEKRHFLDTCLTNYGARRFRSLFNLAANFSPLVAEAMHRREPVWFPVEVYGSAVLRSLLGISAPPDNILGIARAARAMKQLDAQLDAPLGRGEDAVHLGGEAQLEGLAQVSQLHSIEHTFGLQDLLLATTEHVHSLSQRGPYRAIEAVAGALGCADLQGKITRVNTGLASALFVTALCGRFFGLGVDPAPADLVSPSARLSRMLVELGQAPGRYAMSDDEASALVDDVARRLWGRTALEEISADIDAMESKVDLRAAPWLAHEGLSDAYFDFIALRRRVLAAAAQDGLASVLPRAFPTHWRDKLRPWHVVATPGGDAAADGVIVFGRKINVPAGYERIIPELVAWGKLYTSSASESGDVIAPRDRAAWLQMLERQGPRAQLMLNGRQHRRMLAPELERPIEETEALGIPVRFHPRFEWPEPRNQEAREHEAIALAEITGRTRFTCDITGEDIAPTAAAVLTPWEFRRSPLLERFRGDDGNIFKEFQLATDWSDWVVRHDLLV